MPKRNNWPASRPKPPTTADPQAAQATCHPRQRSNVHDDAVMIIMSPIPDGDQSADRPAHLPMALISHHGT